MNNEINRVIKTFNRGSTIKSCEKNKIGPNDDYNIDYNDNLSIRNIIDIFLTEYYKFKTEYAEIEKLTQYDDLRYIDFFKQDDDTKYVWFDFFDDNKTISSKDGYLDLILKSKDGIYYAEIKKMFETSPTIKQNIDKNLIKKYIDFFEKHQFLFKTRDFYDSYNFWFGNGFNVLRFETNGDIFNSLDSIQIYFANLFCNVTDSLEFKIDITKKPKIIKSECEICSKEVDLNNELLNYFLDNIYINKEYLPPLYNEKCDQLKKEENKQLKLKLK